MSQQWKPLGIIHRPDTSQWYAKSGYCHVPTPLVMGDTVRVFYSSLDADMRGRVLYCDLDGSDLTKVKAVSPEPVLDVGPLGAFDCDGVVPSWISGNEMFYIGFLRCQSIPYKLQIGVAWFNPLLGRFVRADVPKPFKEPSLSNGAPFMRYTRGTVSLWYWETREWVRDAKYDGWTRYVNQLCLTTQITVTSWNKHVVMEPNTTNGEYALGRPCVMFEDGLYKMWYSIRAVDIPFYRMGYAESTNGIHWERKDSEVASLMPTNGGNAEYPAIVDSGGKRWMVYNGAANGRDGIELAVLEQD